MALSPGHDVVTPYVQSLIRYKAQQLCRRPGFSKSDQDDLEQEMWMHLVRQAKRFDPARASFATFANHAVFSCAAMILRARRRLKRAAGFDAVSLEATMVTVKGSTMPARQAVSAQHRPRNAADSHRADIEHGEDAEAIAHAMNTMAPALRDVCRRLMSRTIKDAARDTGTSYRQVRLAIRYIRWYLVRAGFQENPRNPYDSIRNGIGNNGRGK